jgi:hypothetical protein
MMHMLGNQKRHSESRNGDDKEWKKEDEKNIDWESSVHGGALHLTRSRRENPAFNYGFFRSNPLVFGWVAWKNDEHAPEFTRGSASQQTEIARPARKSFAYAPGVTSI